MSQLAKLYIRGSLVNKTAKNLTKSQKSQVEDLMQIAWDDPDLDSAKYEFCSILGRTIGNEYANRDFAKAEIMITFWRCAVDVLFHSPNRDGSKEREKKYQKWVDRKSAITTNQIARKKYFKTYLYQYMRQILNENKIPMRTVKKTIGGPANEVAIQIIEFYLQNSAPKRIEYQVSSEADYFSIICETNLIPIKTMKKVCKIADEFKNYDVEFVFLEDEIKIIPGSDVKFVEKKIEEKERAKFNSLSGFNNDDAKNSFQQHCEFQAVNKMEVDVDNMLIQDQITVLKSRLTPQGAKVLELLVNPPKDFLDEFYPRRKKDVRPRESHIAKWLDISKTDVVAHISVIRKQATALDIG